MCCHSIESNWIRAKPTANTWPWTGCQTRSSQSHLYSTDTKCIALTISSDPSGAARKKFNQMMPWLIVMTNSTYRQIKENANDETAQPIEDQQKEIIGRTRFEMVGLQAQRVIIQEITIQHEMESGGRVQWIVKETRCQSPYLRVQIANTISVRWLRQPTHSPYVGRIADYSLGICVWWNTEPNVANALVICRIVPINWCRQTATANISWKLVNFCTKQIYLSLCVSVSDVFADTYSTTLFANEKKLFSND